MSLFLHFLNREAFRSAGYPQDSELVATRLRTITLARADPLYTNYSNLFESGSLTKSTLSITRALIQTGQLYILGERPTLQEFLDSRVAR